MRWMIDLNMKNKKINIRKLFGFELVLYWLNKNSNNYNRDELLQWVDQ
jgi:hypothetical protein